jgi:hypothetical protein
MISRFVLSVSCCALVATMTGCGTTSTIARGQSSGIEQTGHLHEDHSAPYAQGAYDAMYNQHTTFNGVQQASCPQGGYGNCPPQGYSNCPEGCPPGHGGHHFGHIGPDGDWYPTHRHTQSYKTPSNLSYPPPNVPAGAVVYPYYTLKGPSDFFRK